MNDLIKNMLDEAIWVARELFERNKVTGSSANMSLIIDDDLYISTSGTCFGKLTYNSFSVIHKNGSIDGPKPSKELPLHEILYQKDDAIRAVIHTHSFYATLWSCLPHQNEEDCIPSYTPYLKMKLGTVGLVPYAQPGSDELFDAFRACVAKSDGFILKNHGPVVGGKSIMDAFYIIEELEESARMAYMLRKENVSQI